MLYWLCAMISYLHQNVILNRWLCSPPQWQDGSWYSRCQCETKQMRIHCCHSIGQLSSFLFLPHSWNHQPLWWTYPPCKHSSLNQTRLHWLSRTLSWPTLHQSHLLDHIVTLTSNAESGLEGEQWLFPISKYWRHLNRKSTAWHSPDPIVFLRL